MRKLLFLVAFISASIFLHAQNMGDYFKYQGIETLAGLAHPTNTFKSGNYEVYSNRVWVKIYYEGYTTVLEIERDGDFFTDISILSDNDRVSPFARIELIKDIAYEALKDESSNKSKIEEKIGKAFYEMTGIEMACLILTLDWWDY